MIRVIIIMIISLVSQYQLLNWLDPLASNPEFGFSVSLFILMLAVREILVPSFGFEIKESSNG